MRGFSATSMKNMRKFYESWQMLDPNSSVMTDDNSTIAIAETQSPNNQSDSKSATMIADLENTNNQIDTNSAIMIAELQAYKIDIYQAIKIPETKDFPVEDFFRIPFTHHIRIIEGVDDILARYYYIQRASEENLQSRTLEKLIKEDAYSHQDLMPSNFAQTLPNASLARKAVMMFADVVSFHPRRQGEEAPREPVHRHRAVQVGQARLCGVCHPRLQQADGRGHLLHHGRHARKPAESPARCGGVEETAVNEQTRTTMMIEQNTNYAYKLNTTTTTDLCEYCYANSSKEAATRNYKQHEMNPLGETITGK